jgi:hypothetical protein
VARDGGDRAALLAEDAGALIDVDGIVGRVGPESAMELPRDDVGLDTARGLEGAGTDLVG